MEQKYYDSSFFSTHDIGSYNSAKETLPVVLKYIKPQSVIDLGCGIGTWLSVLQNDYNITDIIGVDGEYVNKSQLHIPSERFISHDFKNRFKAPKKFSLAISVEVAEHLPESSADDFVTSLVEASDVILFSAALKGQGGVFHINEQYPEYWAEKFKQHDYIPIDCIRKQIWNNEKIDVWYRQNILVYIKRSVFEAQYRTLLGKEQEVTDPKFLTRIHPELFNFYTGSFERLRTYAGFLNYRLYLIKKLFKK